MKSNLFGVLSSRHDHKFYLVICAICGVLLVLFSTNHYGSGLSPDSVKYIAIARNIISNTKIVSYNDAPLITQPPIYPFFLASIGRVFVADPLPVARILNAIIFGFIIYCAGLLNFRFFTSFRAFALAGTTGVLFSIPLFGVSTMAWSEPLFILFTVLSLIFMSSYLENNSMTSLILIASSIALAVLTRYIGVSLIFWAVFSILFFSHNRLNNKILHLFLLMIITICPLAIWLARNHMVSGTLFGYRASSQFTMCQNLNFTLNTITSWYIHPLVAQRYLIIMILIALPILLLSVYRNGILHKLNIASKQLNVIILFVLAYTSLLVISSTTTAYDKIDYRLLSPVYIPITLLLLILLLASIELYRHYFSIGNTNRLLIIAVAILLLYPFRAVVLDAVKMAQDGRGYSHYSWKNSPTIQYICKQRLLQSEYMIYSNGPDVVYIMANLKCKLSPAIGKTTFSSQVNNILELRGRWPQENKAYLIWFDRIQRKNLFPIHQLKTIATIIESKCFEDGEIYFISSKK